MRALFLSLYFMGLAAVLPAAFAAEPIVVIINNANEQALTEQDIKNIYSDIVTHWNNGQRIHLYNLPAKDDARDTFSRTVFGQSTREIMQEESNRKITNTIKNPSITKRASLITAIVARDKYAIGYLPKNQLRSDTNVRIVLELK